MRPNQKYRLKNGYEQTWDPTQRRWDFTHLLVAAMKLGRRTAGDEHVHHINHDKRDNRPDNLYVLNRRVHMHIHHRDPEACFRCGRSGHWVSECYARRSLLGETLECRKSWPRKRSFRGPEPVNADETAFL